MEIHRHRVIATGSDTRPIVADAPRQNIAIQAVYPVATLCGIGRKIKIAEYIVVALLLHRYMTGEHSFRVRVGHSQQQLMIFSSGT